MLRRSPAPVVPPVDGDAFETSVGQHITPRMIEAGFVEVDALWWGTGTGAQMLQRPGRLGRHRPRRGMQTIGSRLYEAQGDGFSRRFPHLRAVHEAGGPVEATIDYYPERGVVEMSLGPRSLGPVSVNAHGGIDAAVAHLGEGLTSLLA